MNYEKRQEYSEFFSYYKELPLKERISLIKTAKTLLILQNENRVFITCTLCEKKYDLKKEVFYGLSNSAHRL